MPNARNCGFLAKLLIEQKGPDTRDRARTTETLLSYLPVSRDRTSIVEAVRVVEALLSVEGHTIH